MITQSYQSTSNESEDKHINNITYRTKTSEYISSKFCDEFPINVSELKPNKQMLKQYN